MPFERQRGAFSLENLFDVKKGLSLPLKCIGRLSGDAGFGLSAPSALPTEFGVVVSRRGCFSLYSHDLSRELWRQLVKGWSSTVYRLGDTFLSGPLDGYLTEYDIRSGAVLLRLPYVGVAGLRGVENGIYLIRRAGFVDAVDSTGRVLWQRESLPRHVLSSAGYFLINDDLGRVLLCLDSQTGAVKWQFVPPKEGSGDNRDMSNQIPAGFPSVSVVGDRVIVIPRTFRVFTLSLETGEVISAVRPPFVGWYLVTDRSIFFKQAFGLSEFDHREMKEIDRIEYQSEVEPLYRGSRVTVNAFWLTEESVIWTTMHGALMGVSRKAAPDGRRVVWAEEIPGALMPIAEPPVSYGEYLYLTKKGENPQLYCFRSVGPQ